MTDAELSAILGRRPHGLPLAAALPVAQAEPLMTRAPLPRLENLLQRHEPQAPTIHPSRLASDRARMRVRQQSVAAAAAAPERPIRAPRSHPAFPEVLHQMLLEVHESGFDHMVRFADDGDAFWILDRDAMIRELTPEYFRFQSMASFRRQLSLYGFVRVEEGGMSGYRHPLFHRDRPELLSSIRRSYVH